MELEKAIEILKSYENKLVYEISEKDKEAVTVVLNHITKQEKMIDKMADEILDLNSMIAEKSELFSVVPIWLGKEHIKEYFKGITNKKAEESE